MASTRDRLITSTLELFRRQGYHGTALSQVTTAAEAPTGSLYHHFKGGKRELTVAVLDSAGAIYRELLETIWDDSPGPVAAVRAFFDGAASVLEATDFIDPCPVGTVAREVASSDETLRLASRDVFQTWIGAAEQRLVDAGLTAPAARDFALTLVAAIEGGFVLSRTGRDAGALRTIGNQLANQLEGLLAANPGARSGARPGEPTGS